MASSFPGAIDNFTDPLSNSSLASPSHAGQHSDLNDAVEKIETYMGLVKVIPTVASVGGTAATVSANGTVTVGNGNTSVTLTCFSALYDNYRILYTSGAASTNAQLRLQLAGIATGYYGGLAGTNYATSAFYGQNDNNATVWSWVGYASTGGGLAEIDVFTPFLTQRKTITAKNVYVFSGNAYGTFVGECTATSSANGFALSPSTGTFTGGTIRVYGYRN